MTEMKDENSKLYPNLELPVQQPTAPNYYQAIQPYATSNTQSFRLHKINEIQKILESERDTRSHLAKKYQRGINILSGLTYAFEFTSVGLGVAGVTLLTTVVATPVVIAMEGIALGVGGLSAAINLICDKALSSKAKKHYQIMMLAQSKLNTISDHVSKALQDNIVSDEEFTMILSELDKYHQMKEEIRSKTKTKIDDETKQSLIKQGKDKAIEEFQSMFAGAKPAGAGATKQTN